MRIRKVPSSDQQMTLEEVLSAEEQPETVEGLARDEDGSELPEGWKLATLGEVVQLNMGQSPEGEATNIIGQGIPLIGGAADYSGDSIRAARYTTSPTKCCRTGDLILCIRATIGKIAIADREYCLGRGVAGLRPLNINTRFLQYFLTEQAPLLDRAGTGTTFRQVDKKTLSLWPISLPPLDEQRRIVATLDRLFARSKRARAELERVPRLVERMKQAVLAAAFSGELTREWQTEGESAIILLEQISAERMLSDSRRRSGQAQSPPTGLPDLPENWVWTTIGNLFDVTIGGTPSRKEASFWDGSIPWISSGEVSFRRIHSTREMITDKGLMNSNAKLLPPGTVLLGMIGEGRTRGQAAILKIPATSNQNAAAILCASTPIPPEWLYYWLMASYETTRGDGVGGVQPALNSERVRQLDIPLAPLAEQAEIVRRIEAAFARIDGMAAEAARATALLDRLDQATLAVAFRGEL